MKRVKVKEHTRGPPGSRKSKKTKKVKTPKTPKPGKGVQALLPMKG